MTTPNTMIGWLGAAALLSAPLSARADDMTAAVAAPNGKVEATSGDVGGKFTAGFAGSGSLPIGHDFGLQIDGGMVNRDSETGGGTALHLFTRDPDQYLLGMTTLWVRNDGHDIMRTGLEGEYYLGNFTATAAGGFQNSKKGPTQYFSADVGYYVTDDLYLRTGVQGYSQYREVYAGGEWRPWESESTSFFTDIGAGNEVGGYATVGIRYSFGGGPISLKTQHRHYDPPNIVGTYMNGSTSTSSQNAIAAKRAAPAPVRIDGGEI